MARVRLPGTGGKRCLIRSRETNPPGTVAVAAAQGVVVLEAKGRSCRDRNSPDTRVRMVVRESKCSARKSWISVTACPARSA